MFLQYELIRSETVEDETILRVVGLRGTPKAVAAPNLWHGVPRVGLTSDLVPSYFAAGVAIDPLQACGAHLVGLAGARQFDHMLDYLRLQAE